MKWIKSRTQYLNEAKVGEVILPSQKKAIISTWGANILELETIEASNEIVQGEWKLTQEEKLEALGTFFGKEGEVIDLKKIYQRFENLPEEFIEVINDSMRPLLLDSNTTLDADTKKIFQNFDPRNPSLNQLSKFNGNIFRKISVSESTADMIIIKDESGRPIKDESNQIQKRKREEGEVLFEKNLVNINGLVEGYNRIQPDKQVKPETFTDREIAIVISKSAEDFGKDNFKVDINLYGGDLWLKIKHNPKDILNMSISRFYASCQHLYTGMYKNQVIGNVFDPNSIPAFITFDSPVYNESGEMVSEQLPLSRMVVRSVVPINKSDEGGIYFDRTYPDRMKDFFDKIVEKYTGMEHNPRIRGYVYTPDLPQEITLEQPYMDRLGLTKVDVIGINTKSITFGDEFSWQNFRILPKARIQEIVIATTNLPQNFFELNLNPTWIKFKCIEIKNLNPFDKLVSECWGFDKCVINKDVFREFGSTHQEVKKLNFTNCTVNDLSFEAFKNLEELHLVYSCTLDEFKEVVEKTGFKSSGSVKKYTISGDLTFGAGGSELIKSLRNAGYQITIVGPKKK